MDLTLEQKTFLVSWIKENFTPIININYDFTDYGLKQKFSRLNFYVTQEQFTDAMGSAGFKVENKTSEHYSFNISKKSKFFELN